MSAPLVLLVNDIPDHLDSYAMALRARGFRIAIVESGGEAVAMARADRPACIVIDERLSDMRGWDLCAEMKKDPTLSTIPIIMLAHELTFEAASEGRRVGCESWLARPNIPGDLANAVADVLATHAAAPRSTEEALVGFATCGGCASPRVRAGLRVGPVQYHICRDCGLRWRTDAAGEAIA